MWEMKDRDVYYHWHTQYRNRVTGRQKESLLEGIVWCNALSGMKSICDTLNYNVDWGRNTS